MAHEDDGASVAAELVDLLRAPTLEALVADRQHLVDQHHLRLDVGRDGEAEADEHARRVVLDRRVDELLEPGELDDLVEAARDLALGEPEDRAVQEDVLAAAQLRVEAGAELEERRDTTAHVTPPRSGCRMPARHLSIVLLPDPLGPMTPNVDPVGTSNDTPFNAQNSSYRARRAAQDRRLQILISLVIEPEALPDGVDGHGDLGHAVSSLADAERRTNHPHRPVDSAATGTMSAPMHAVDDVYQSRELLWNLTLRELRTKYRRSFLGWAWSMLNPLATVAVYGFVFGVLFQATAPPGDPSGLTAFALYMLCALLPWNFFALVNKLGLGAVSGNSGLVRRVAFPTEILVFSNVLHACVQFSIEMTLLFVVLIVAGSPIIPWLPVVVAHVVAAGDVRDRVRAGLSALAVYFRDMNYLWAIVLQVWFFATPIVYSPELLEDRAPEWVQQVLQAEPDAPVRGGVSTLPLRRRGARMEDDGRAHARVVRLPHRRLGDLPQVRAAAPGGGLNA